MFSKKLIIVLLGLLFLFSCSQESAFVASPEKGQISISETPIDQGVTAREIGTAHGNLVKIFMNNLFNDALQDPAAKARFLANNGVDSQTFKTVFIKSVNEYFVLEGKNVRMTEGDYVYLEANVPRFRTGSSAEIRARLRSFHEQGRLSDHALAQVIAGVDRIDQAVSKQGLPIEDAQVLLAPPTPYGPNGPEEFDVQVFNAIAVNSAQTWSELMADTDWINDAELVGWWHWFRDSEKGRAIGTIAADAVGGIAFCVLSGGNPIWTLVGGAGASIVFANWAYQGM